MNDPELDIYLLELTQLMKREKLHNSALVRFLLYRGAWQYIIGHARNNMYVNLSRAWL